MTTIASRSSRVVNVSRQPWPARINLPDVAIAAPSVKIDRPVPAADAPVHGWGRRLLTVPWDVLVKMFHVLAGPPMSERDQLRWDFREAQVRNHMAAARNRPWW